MKQNDALARAAVEAAISRDHRLLSIITDLDVSRRACEGQPDHDVFELSFYERALEITCGKWLTARMNPDKQRMLIG
jgi:hypothetical protein